MCGGPDLQPLESNPFKCSDNQDASKLNIINTSVAIRACCQHLGPHQPGPGLLPLFCARVWPPAVRVARQHLTGMLALPSQHAVLSRCRRHPAAAGFANWLQAASLVSYNPFA